MTPNDDILGADGLQVDLPQDTQGIEAVEAMPDADSLDELERDLAAAMEQFNRGKAVAAARKRLKTEGPRMEASERAAIEASIRRWEDEREWTSVCNGALFHRQFCTRCGEVHTHYNGMMVLQDHRLTKHTRRWVRVPAAEAGLPNKVLYHDQHVGACFSCAQLDGWDFQAGEALFVDHGAVQAQLVIDIPAAQPVAPDQGDSNVQA